MQCANCGLPLSPDKTLSNCPRCQRPLAAGSWQALQNASFQPSSTPQWASASLQEQQDFVNAPPSGQLQQPPPGSSRLSTPAPLASHPYGSSAPYTTSNQATGPMYPLSGANIRPQMPRTSNIGFVLAGLCVFAGALILVFVYFMALALPSAPPPNSTFTGTAQATTPRNAASTPAAAAPTPTVIPSPTMNGSAGAQYIDNPQMASAVNFNTAQPLQATTTFKTNQKVYVTFNLHPAGRNGAVCLYWYLDKKFIAQYPFPVTPNDQAGYSYAVYGGAGPASVEIYWASTTACGDKILAQKVQFTVTA